ncbi:YggS family pyridoxal phosphate enzyme [Hahella sp. CCB-MM4]|uniref:YggS family pyridoxal phosphate-dependent enzyme n=1 Tax=Hahella sp. (strain CCB-MM4) TaxID=1926491 RepID=UPI000B9A886E|nr:YggS family pyridoxal phosphate-dependent enzyme [Hahella sp. CCB-MM4]OZG74259.1 YggS family pyridoxal phosphate enzyme [Hahella sp. CCB-MM4]
MISIADNINSVSLRIQNATKSAGRQAGEVALLAVSKTKPSEAIRAAYAAGLRDFGENYLQEALQKIQELSDLSIQWHFIGPLQSNKTRQVAEHFHWIHTVDRLKIATRLSEQRPENMPLLNVCIQVNIDEEDSKSGVPLDEVKSLAADIAKLPRLCLRGLMCIPNPSHDQSTLAESFRKVAAVAEDLKSRHNTIDTLSMGMSQDMEVAIAEGSTIVRIGTAIFGERDYSGR